MDITNKLKLVQNLRPVEALYILDEVGKEEWSETNALAATLAYLDINGHIEFDKRRGKDIKFKETTVSKKNIRVYENWCLNSIYDDDVQNLVDNVYQNDIRMALIDRLFIDKGTKQVPFLWIFRQTVPSYNNTKRLYDSIDELEELKEEIVSKRKTGRLDNYLSGMAYAFPSINKDKKYMNHARRIIDITDYNRRKKINDENDDLMQINNLNSINNANYLMSP